VIPQGSIVSLPFLFFGDFWSFFLGFSWEGFGGVSLRDLFWESHMGFVPLLGVFIISPKFRLKTPSGLGDPLIESLGLFRGLIF
jgi:hypothetical protein